MVETIYNETSYFILVIYIPKYCIVFHSFCLQCCQSLWIYLSGVRSKRKHLSHTAFFVVGHYMQVGNPDFFTKMGGSQKQCTQRMFFVTNLHCRGCFCDVKFIFLSCSGSDDCMLLSYFLHRLSCTTSVYCFSKSSILVKKIR
ncbi:hypothetical protein AAZX31_07G205700 [Glycine max]